MSMLKQSALALSGLIFLASIPIGIVRYEKHQQSQEAITKQRMDLLLTPPLLDSSFRLVDVTGKQALIANTQGMWHVSQGDTLPDGSTVWTITGSQLINSRGQAYEIKP